MESLLMMKKKLIILLSLLILTVTCSFSKNNFMNNLLLNSNTFFLKKIFEEIRLSSKPIAKINIGTLGLALDNEKNLYIGKYREIYKITPEKKVVMVGNMNDSSDDFTNTIITDLDFGNDNCLYAAAKDRIIKIDSNGVMSTYIKEDFKERNGIFGIEFDQNGNLYVSCQNKILKYTPSKERSVFISNDNVKIKLDNIMGLEFDNNYKNLYICETDYGQIIKIPYKKNGNAGIPEVFFKKYDYAPRYLKFFSNGDLLIKDCASKYFYLLSKEKTIKIIVDDVAQKSFGLESFVIDPNNEKKIYANIYDGIVYQIYLNF